MQETLEPKEQRIKEVCLEGSLPVLLSESLCVLVSQTSRTDRPQGGQGETEAQVPSLGVRSLPLFFLVVIFLGLIIPGHLSNKILGAR